MLLEEGACEKMMGHLNHNEKDGVKIWKAHMSKIMNEENWIKLQMQML